MIYISTMSLIMIIYISEVLLTLGVQITAGSIKGATNYQESLKTELAAVKNLSMSHAAEPAPPLPSSSYAAATATATNSQNGHRSRPQRTHVQQCKPANPSTATHTSAVRTSEPSAEAATLGDARSQGSSESRSRESRKVAVVPGKRAIWGTLPFVTPTTVKSTIHNMLSVPDNSITVKRKTKTLRAKQCWWFVITGTEGTLMSLETNWNKNNLMTFQIVLHLFRMTILLTLLVLVLVKLALLTPLLKLPIVPLQPVLVTPLSPKVTL